MKTITITEKGKAAIGKNTVTWKGSVNEDHLLSELGNNTREGTQFVSHFEKFDYKEPDLDECITTLMFRGFITQSNNL